MTWLAITECPSQRPWICSVCRDHNLTLPPSSWFDKSNTTGATSDTGTVYPSGEPGFTPDLIWRPCCSIVSRVHCVFFCPLYCLSFFDLQLLITPLISSNIWSLYCLSFLDLRLWYLQTFGHCIVCPFWSYACGIFKHLAIALSVLRLKASDNPRGIFNIFLFHI